MLFSQLLEKLSIPLIMVSYFMSLILCDPLHSWLKSYISNRQQFVKVHNFASVLNTYSYGVPRGGPLSPLLFILFINIIRNYVIRAKLLFFIDAIQIYSEINSHNNCFTLQSELSFFHDWADRLGLSLNYKNIMLSFTITHLILLLLIVFLL